MEKIEFGAVLTSEYDGFLIERYGKKCYIEFANGNVVEDDVLVIPVIAKEIASLKFNKKKEVGVYLLYNGIIVCENENNSCGEKLFSSEDVKLEDVYEIKICSEGEEKKNLIRRNSNKWQAVLNAEIKFLEYYDEQAVAQLIFETLLTEFENKSETFKIKRDGKKLIITL